MTMLTSDANKAFIRDHVGELIVQPVHNNSLAMRLAKTPVVETATGGYREPIVSGDPTAAWVAEGAEIAASEATFDEAVTPFYKVAGLTAASRELIADTDPEAANIVGNGLARDIARKIDAAFFGARGSNTLQIRGLGDVEGVNTIEVESIGNIDVFTQAIFDAAAVGANLAGFVTHPSTALELAKLKEQSGSNKNLLQPIATEQLASHEKDVNAAKLQVGGVALYTSPYVPENIVYGVPAQLTTIAIRTGTQIDIDESHYFSSDRVAIRAIMRVGTTFPHEAAIQKIIIGEQE